jgi:hypothetical protein
MPDQPSPRRRFQFRLRTLMIVVVPYVAINAAVVSYLLSGLRDEPPTEPRFDILNIGHAISNAIEAGFWRLAIWLTTAWICLPFVVWLLWRFVSRMRQPRDSTAQS